MTKKFKIFALIAFIPFLAFAQSGSPVAVPPAQNTSSSESSSQSTNQSSSPSSTPSPVSAASSNTNVSLNQNQNTPNLFVEINDEVDKRLQSADSSSGLKIYSSRSGQGAVRNPNTWIQKISPLDLTGVSGWNDGDGVTNNIWGGATLITPRHYVGAWHFNLAKGLKLTFFDRNGRAVTRTIVDSVNIPGTDIGVGLLDRDVDSSIAHYSLLDSSSLIDGTYASNSSYPDTPLVVLNQFGEATLAKLVTATSNAISHQLYTSGSKAAFGKVLILGDSGQPMFLVVNNTPVLLSTNTSPSAGPNLGFRLSEINAAINSLGSYGYHASTYSLASFQKSQAKSVYVSQNIDLQPLTPSPTFTAVASPKVVAQQNQSSNSSSGGNTTIYSNQSPTPNATASPEAQAGKVSGSSGVVSSVSNTSSGGISTVPPVSSKRSSGGSYLPYYGIVGNPKLGDNNTDVLNLQIALNRLGYIVAKEGPGSPGNETNYFGQATKNALEAFQRDNNSSGLNISGQVDNTTKTLLNSSSVKAADGKIVSLNASSSAETVSGGGFVGLVQKSVVFLLNKIAEIFSGILHFFKLF